MKNNHLILPLALGVSLLTVGCSGEQMMCLVNRATCGKVVVIQDTDPSSTPVEPEATPTPEPTTFATPTIDPEVTASPSPTTPGAIEGGVAPAPNQTASVNTENVNVRTNPTVSSDSRARLNPGDLVTLTGERSQDEAGQNWESVRLPDGSTGYIRSDLLVLQGGEPPAPVSEGQPGDL